MFQKLITYSIRHKLVIGVLSIALAIWGVWSLVHLPFDSTPDITDNQVQVITQAPSLGAPLSAKTYCFPSALTMAWDGKARHCWLPVAIFPLTYIPAKSFPP